MPPQQTELQEIIERLTVLESQHKKMIRRSRVMFYLAVLKVVLILTPLVLGLIYLPPLLKDVFQQYQELLNLKSGLNVGDVNNLDVDSIKLNPELLKLLNK